MSVTIESLPALRVATLRHVGPYREMGAVFQRLGEIAGRAGLFRFPNTMMMTIPYSDPTVTPEAELVTFAGVTVEESDALPEGMEELRLPASRYACLTWIGPYSGLAAAWARIWGEWLPTSGHRPGSSPCFEVYRNSPADTAPEALRTDIYVPLAD